MTNNNIIKMVAGLDIGNGYVKGSIGIDGFENISSVDYLSGVAIQTSSHDIKVKSEEAKEIINDIYNYMEASFDSSAVENKSTRLFGRRGISSGKSTEEFDVSSTISKATQDLSGVLVLGSLAGKALQVYYDRNGVIPTETLKVEARLSLALPISEYKIYRKAYADKFKSSTHMVSIGNFESPVRVEIVITDVTVTAEGASAQYAIASRGKVLMDAMLKDLRTRGEKLEGVTSEDILAAENIISVDIGEGTVNFPVFQNGRFNPDASMTFAKGYGTVLEQARERLQEKNLPFNSRKALADFLLKKPNALNKNRYNMVKNIVDEELQGFTIEVIQEFRKAISRVGSYTEVVYVYGGGATPVKEFLYPQLINVAKNLGGEDVAYPVLYLDSKYSRYLNKEGLFVIAKQVFYQDLKKKAETSKAQTK